jgi:cell cycle sensor histidine kinase DivJ
MVGACSSVQSRPEILQPAHHPSGPLRSVSGFIAGLAPPHIAADPIASARLNRFILRQLGLGLAALAAFPPYLAPRGTLTLVEAAIFALLVAPRAIVALLARTGQVERAQILSSLVSVLTIALLGAATGGLGSIAIAWLIVSPLDAAASGSKRATWYAIGFSAIAAGVLLILDETGLLPSSGGTTGNPILHVLGLAGAVAYAAWHSFTQLRTEADSAALTRQGESRYELLARTMDDMVTRHIATGAVVYASPSARVLMQAEPDSLAGQGLFERVHVTDRLHYLTALAGASTRGEETTIEFRARRGDGPNARIIWLEMRCRPFEEGVGQVIAITRDISERKAHEIALEDARAQAERANIAKGRFIATMSHELRTPLNAIIGFSEILMNVEEHRVSPQRQLEYSRLIHESGQHLLAVVNGILDMSKIENGNFPIEAEPLDVTALVDNCCAMMRLKADGAKIAIRSSVAPDLPKLVADKRACRQIFINLLSNALKFTQTGGSITIGARQHGNGIVLFVSDTGIGVGPEDIARLGEPFFQARSSYDRPFDGTGLGLSVVKGLASVHGGRMEIESRLGHGTTVSVILPLHFVGKDGRAAIEPPSNVEPFAPPAPQPVRAPLERPLSTQEVPEKKIA